MSFSFERYDAPTGPESLLRLLPNSKQQVVIIEPLLEERNFLRRTVMDIARRLGANGIGANIPDLPACGESLVDPAAVSFSRWREAVASAAAAVSEQSRHPVHIVSLRGGALLDDAADAASWWRFAAASGHDLVRPFRRAQRLRGEAEAIDITGYGFAPAMIETLAAATPAKPGGPLRDAIADSTSVPLWNRAEPSSNNELSQYLADDISQWIATCVAS